MSEANVANEEISIEEKDEKKVKKKRSLKSSEGKSKSSSRKSSGVSNAEIDGYEATESQEPNEIQGDSESEIFTENENPGGISSDEKPIVGIDSPLKKSGGTAKNVIMLREIDFRTLAELKEAFHLFDINRDGYIDKDDLKFTFTSMGRPDISDESVEQMLSEMSSNKVDFDAFVKLFGYKSIELDSEEELLAALAKWDYHGNGMISEEILKRDLQGWGDKFSAKEAERALEEAPLYKKDGITMIDYVKFCHDICGLRNIEKTREIEKEAEAYDRELESLIKQ